MFFFFFFFACVARHVFNTVKNITPISRDHVIDHSWVGVLSVICRHECKFKTSDILVFGGFFISYGKGVSLFHMGRGLFWEGCSFISDGKGISLFHMGRGFFISYGKGVSLFHMGRGFLYFIWEGGFFISYGNHFTWFSHRTLAIHTRWKLLHTSSQMQRRIYAHDCML